MPSTHPPPIPVLLLGKTVQTGAPVAELLKPEYEVIHFMQSPAQAATSTAAILDGQASSLDTSSDTVGTLNFSVIPCVVILGGAWEEDAVQDLRAQVAEKVNARAQANAEQTTSTTATAVPGERLLDKVVWLMRGPDWESRVGPLGPAYPGKVVGSVKSVLKGLRDGDGGEGFGKGGIVYW